MNTKTLQVVFRTIEFVLIVGLVVSTDTMTAFSHDGQDGENGGWRVPCGKMEFIPVYGKGVFPDSTQSYIIDAWTTNLPHADPWNEVYTFQFGVDTLAFVTEFYFAEGGFIPLQYSRIWDCVTLRPRHICHYDWTLGPLPPGFSWLLINYYPPETVPHFPGDFDWATLVGDALFGWPDPDNSRPYCFTLSP